MYAIMSETLIGHVEEHDADITISMFLGVDHPPMNVYVYDDEVTERTKLFDSFEDAARYLEKHPNLYDSMTAKGYKVVRV